MRAPTTTPAPVLAIRKPQRLSVTVSYGVMQALQQRANTEGRSVSNLAAFLLEHALGAGPR